MDYFWAERAEGFAAGQAPPLGERSAAAGGTHPMLL